MTRTTILAAALFAAPLAHAADAPAAGDVVGGARTFRLHCAACHGPSGGGNGPVAAGLEAKPPRLRDGGTLYARTDEELLAKILGQGQKGPMTLHGRGLSQLDARDVLAWMRQGVPDVGQLFPEASQFIAHKQVLDADGLARAEKALGEALPDDEKSLMVFVPLKPEEGTASGAPTKVPEEPGPLYDAKPRRKLGFMAYLPLKVDAGTFDVAMTLDRGMHISAVKLLPCDDALEPARKKLQPLLESFVGAGGREDKRPIEPQAKGVKASKDVLAAMLRAYTRLLEASAMYAKEERDRFWADPDAFKFPGASDQPADVKFDFKQKK